MASTGTATYTLNRDQLISRALRKIRVLQDGQTASANMITDGAEDLNVVIKNIQSDGLMLWTYQTVVIPCIVNKFTYTLGPVGADITMNRPLRLFPGSFIRDNTVSPPNDTPLTIMARVDYLNLGNKSSSGIVNQLYYDSQFNTVAGVTSTSTGFGTLYVYVNPVDAQHSIYGNFQRQLFDMSNGTDEFDFPAEAFQALTWCLAAEMCDEYEVPEERITRVERKAKYYRDQLEDWSVETAPTNFTPDWQMGNRMR